MRNDALGDLALEINALANSLQRHSDGARWRRWRCWSG
jgi:hypothetical protein